MAADVRSFTLNAKIAEDDNDVDDDERDRRRRRQIVPCCGEEGGGTFALLLAAPSLSRATLRTHLCMLYDNATFSF